MCNTALKMQSSNIEQPILSISSGLQMSESATNPNTVSAMQSSNNNNKQSTSMILSNLPTSQPVPKPSATPKVEPLEEQSSPSISSGSLMTEPVANPNTELKRAVMKSDIDAARKLLATGELDVNANPYDLLYVAVKNCDAPMVELLLEHGAKPDYTTPANAISGALEEDRKYLWMAVTYRYNEIVKLLINAGADVDLRNEGNFQTDIYLGTYGSYDMRNQTVLQRCICNKDTELAYLLIENGADINAVDNMMDTPLIYAINNKMSELAKDLIRRGADINWRNSKGFSVLHVAAFSGSCELVELLLSMGAVAQDEDGKMVLLNLLAELHSRNSYAVLELLLKHGMDVNRQDENGNTPLHCALRQNLRFHPVFQMIPPGDFYKKIELLLEYGADVRIRNRDENFTPIGVMTIFYAEAPERNHSFNQIARLRRIDPNKPAARRNIHHCLPILRHVIRLRFQGAPVAEDDVRAISFHPVLGTIYQEHEEQFAAMERAVVHKGTSYASFFGLAYFALVKLTRNAELVRAFDEFDDAAFPLFSAETRARVGTARKIGRELRDIERDLTSVFGMILPSEVIELIATFSYGRDKACRF